MKRSAKLRFAMDPSTQPVERTASQAHNCPVDRAHTVSMAHVSIERGTLVMMDRRSGNDDREE